MTDAAFYSVARTRVFGGQMTQTQVDGCETILAATHGLPVSHRAYLLATAFHETARTMQPVRETLDDTDAKAIARLEAAFKAGKLPWVKTPYWRRDAYGKSWLGRGYVQLTHKANYEKAGEKLGVDLEGDPDLAMQPTVAALVLVRGCSEGWFTGKKLADYLPGDYIGARRVVNGTDKAAMIAGYAEGFEAALLASTPVVASPAPDPVIKPRVNETAETLTRPAHHVNAAPSGFIWRAITALIALIFGGRK